MDCSAFSSASVWFCLGCGFCFRFSCLSRVDWKEREPSGGGTAHASRSKQAHHIPTPTALPLVALMAERRPVGSYASTAGFWLGRAAPPPAARPRPSSPGAPRPPPPPLRAGAQQPGRPAWRGRGSERPAPRSGGGPRGGATRSGPARSAGPGRRWRARSPRRPPARGSQLGPCGPPEGFGQALGRNHEVIGRVGFVRLC